MQEIILILALISSAIWITANLKNKENAENKVFWTFLIMTITSVVVYFNTAEVGSNYLEGFIAGLLFSGGLWLLFTDTSQAENPFAVYAQTSIIAAVYYALQYSEYKTSWITCGILFIIGTILAKDKLSLNVQSILASLLSIAGLAVMASSFSASAFLIFAITGLILGTIISYKKESGNTITSITQAIFLTASMLIYSIVKPEFELLAFTPTLIPLLALPFMTLKNEHTVIEITGFFLIQLAVAGLYL